jgi:hypothetical protein
MRPKVEANPSSHISWGLLQDHASQRCGTFNTVRCIPGHKGSHIVQR